MKPCLGKCPLLEAENIQQKELSTQKTNGGATPRMKIAFDISSMVSKQDPLTLLNLYLCRGFLSH